MVNVVMDIGNARIKWARVEQGRLVGQGHALHVESIDRALDALAASLPNTVDRVVAANVAGPEFAQRLGALIRRRYRVDPEFVATRAEQLGVRCAYADPSKLGVDRWVAMIAAHHAAARAACVIAAGTAVTFDAVDARGVHLGGLILAGPRLMARALELNTHGIGETSPAAAPGTGLDLLGKSTEAAVGSGAMLALAAALDRALGRVAGSLGETPAVFLTGGDGPALRGWLETELEVEPRADLVLEGLALVMLGSGQT
jgi:type III pantothenate kinase